MNWRCNRGAGSIELNSQFTVKMPPEQAAEREWYYEI